MIESNLIGLRRRAERAVADMPDGELKVKAFEVMLNHLLTSNDQTPKDEVSIKKVDKEPKASKHAAGSATERILALKHEEYFRELRTIGQVREELATRGWHYPVTTLSGPLQELVQHRELRRQKMPEGKRKVWKYSNP